MQCPVCGSAENILVLESRTVQGGVNHGSKRRRRECKMCNSRWSTFEVVDHELRILRQTRQTAVNLFSKKLLSEIEAAAIDYRFRNQRGRWMHHRPPEYSDE